MKSSKTATLVNRISKCPMSPKDLPPNVQKHAYDHDDGPVRESIQRLKQVVINHVPLRKNSKLLAKESASSSRGGVEGAGVGVGTLLSGLTSLLFREPDQPQGLHLRIGASRTPSISSEDDGTALSPFAAISAGSRPRAASRLETARLASCFSLTDFRLARW